MTSCFVLDPRLQADTVFITALALSDLRLMNDRRWPWLVLVPRFAGAEEVHRLPAQEQGQLYREISHVAGVMQAQTRCDKINIGALGNIVRQLHVHIIARKAGDTNWPGPVWGYGRAQPYARDEQAALAGRFHRLLHEGP